MDAGFMRERISTDDRLVRLDHHSSTQTYQLTRLDDLRRVDVRLETKDCLPGYECHHDFFQRRVPRTFADSIHGDLCLTRSVQDTRQGVRRREPQIIVAMN